MAIKIFNYLFIYDGYVLCLFFCSDFMAGEMVITGSPWNFFT